MILMIPRCRLVGHSHNCHGDPFTNAIEWIFIADTEVYNIYILVMLGTIFLSIGLVISDFVIAFTAACTEMIQKCD